MAGLCGCDVTLCVRACARMGEYLLQLHAVINIVDALCAPAFIFYCTRQSQSRRLDAFADVSLALVRSGGALLARSGLLSFALLLFRCALVCFGLLCSALPFYGVLCSALLCSDRFRAVILYDVTDGLAARSRVCVCMCVLEYFTPTARSFLMKRMDAEAIKTRLEAGQVVQAEMTWSLPAPDDRVEWSLWTSAMDTSAAVGL